MSSKRGWLIVAALLIIWLGSRSTALGQASDGSGAGIVGRAFEAPGVPRAPSSLLNVATAGEQRRPDVAVFPEGDFIAVWDAPEGDDAGLGIVGRRFDADATPLGTEIQVNTYTSGNQRRPSVAIHDDGTFLVAWDSTNAQDGAGTGVFAQRFARDGARLGGEFQVNRDTTGAQEVPDVAATADGFVIVFESDVGDSNVSSISAQRFDTSAQAVGTELNVSSYSPNAQRRPAIAATPDGGFMVVWDSGGQDGGGRGVFGRRYDSGGATVGGEIQINSYTSAAQRSPVLAVDATGRFLVVWQSAAQDGSGFGIFGQHYGDDGIRIGTEFQINAATTGDQLDPDVTADTQNSFVVVWQSVGDDGERYGITARRVDTDAVAGEPFVVNEDGSGDQTLPAIASAGDGTVIVWQTRAYCPGDCDDSGAVTVDELVRGVNLALNRAVQFCSAIDANGDESVTVDELVRAVNATLTGCPP